MRRRLLVAAAVLLGLAPATARAQSEGPIDAAAASPSLECNLVGIRILTDDVNLARLVCRVTGASAGDTSFSISLTRPGEAIEVRPLCTNQLSGGAGACLGGVVDPSSPVSVRATLQPSGATLGPVMIGPAPAQPQTEPMQFFPLGD